MKRSIDFYARVLGLHLIEETTNVAKLGMEDGTVLVQLVETTDLSWLP
ncbi:VOC family protein [Paraliobacillus sediminis]